MSSRGLPSQGVGESPPWLGTGRGGDTPEVETSGTALESPSKGLFGVKMNHTGDTLKGPENGFSGGLPSCLPSAQGEKANLALHWEGESWG